LLSQFLLHGHSQLFELRPLTGQARLVVGEAAADGFQLDLASAELAAKEQCGGHCAGAAGIDRQLPPSERCVVDDRRGADGCHAGAYQPDRQP
jgi:hypothetical protein